jgi:hypothetical protein
VAARRRQFERAAETCQAFSATSNILCGTEAYAENLTHNSCSEDSALVHGRRASPSPKQLPLVGRIAQAARASLDAVPIPDVLLPFAVWKNSPSVARPHDAGGGWGLPSAGEPTVHPKGWPLR